MLIRFLVIASFCALSPFHSFAQSASGVSPIKQTSPAAASPRFEAARVDRNMRIPIPVQGGPTRVGDRYMIYAHSMQSLVSIAYSIPENEVIGGPPWLERDRYDIEAKIPTGTGYADLSLMLKALLEERFHLTAHNGTFPQPARLLYQEKGGSKLKASDGKGDSGCKQEPFTPGGPPKFTYDCHNQTIDDLAKLLEDIAGWQDKRPVIDNTGLKGGFDFKLSWTPDGARAMAAITGTGSDSVSLADALSSELGLKIENGTAPWPGLLVDNADEEPAPDPPETAKIMPPRPLPQFDVSVIKPFQPGGSMRGMIGNGHLEVNGITLRNLISIAWELNNTIPVVGARSWLDTDRWYIDAKVLGDQSGANGDTPLAVNPDQFELMVRALLAERFHLQAHMEEREGDVYDLVVANPKLLTPADPNLPSYDRRRRETCVVAPGPDGIDPRIKNPALDVLHYCTNVSMEDFAAGLQSLGAPVRDKTGLKGRYDYALSFSRGAGAQGNGSAVAAQNGSPANGPTASDPNGAISQVDAIRTELGLKLVKDRALVPVLVIDHIDETPTPN